MRASISNFKFQILNSLSKQELGLTTFSLHEGGFTLIELIVVLAMLGILFVVLITVVNPMAQIVKAQDGNRKHDLEQVKQALDTYYNDHGCYPTSAVFQYGSVFSDSKVTYMQKSPQDPLCGSNGYCYVYSYDTSSSCPQWDVLYAALSGSATSGTTTQCALTNLSSCLPKNWNGGAAYNFCLVSGATNCGVVSGSTLPGPGCNSSGCIGGGGGGGGGSTPFPTPTPIFCKSGYFACTGNPAACNSEMPNNCTINGGSYPCFCNLSSCVASCGR